LAPAERAQVVRTWLEKASRGNLAGVDMPTIGGLIAESEPLNARDSAKVYRRWRKTLERALGRWRRSRLRSDAGLETLGLLGRLHSRVPQAERAAVGDLLLAPLRERRAPGQASYFDGLGKWLSEASLSPAEFEDALNLLVNFPMDRGVNAASFLPVYRALAESPAMPQELKAGFHQFLGGLSAEMRATAGWNGYNAALELNRLRARLGFVREAWASMREAIEPYLTAPDSINGDAFTTLDRFFTDSPPPVLERAWLAPGLRDAMRNSRNPSVKGMAALLLARVLDSDEERLSVLIAALTETPVDTNQNYPAIHAVMLKELRAVSKRILAAGGKADDWDSVVAENAGRLNSAR
jgi:hypothetical protein